MRKKLLKISALAAVGFGAWLAVNLYELHTINRGMPPGFYLQCDGKGHYRPCRIGGSDLFWIRGPGTKAAAIRRAWRQAAWDAEDEPAKWERCNDR